MGEVADQIYETVVSEEVRYLLAPQDPRFFEFHVQVPEDNGVSDALQGLPQVSQVLQHQRRKLRTDEWGPGESGDDLAAYHIWSVVACGFNPPPDGPLHRHQSDATLSSLSYGRPRQQGGHVVA